MPVYQLNPLQDRRWAELVKRHPAASVFHTNGWIESLQRTYGYDPIVFTTSPPGAALANGLLFCKVRSWITGKRLVSLPFSDHCEPLIQDDSELAEICSHLKEERRTHGWRYIEVRTRAKGAAERGFQVGDKFWLHTLDLRPDETRLFGALHKDSIQRKIRRAEREGLTCEEGRDNTVLRAFYDLVVLTRARHQLPPQPFAWFSHLAECLGPSINLRIARFRERPIAGVLTLTHRDTLVYKYGASDASLHPLGGMPLLFWKTIQAGRALGCTVLDLGRSGLEDEGLVTFKSRLGAQRSAMTYWRYPGVASDQSSVRRYVLSHARQVFAHVPAGVRAATGRLLYKHVG